MDKTSWGRFKPMDLVGFSSWSGLGVGINLFSLGVPFYHLSHIAVVARHPEHPLPLLCESTMMYDEPCVVRGEVIDGVQWHKIGPRIRGYRGLVYHYPLRIPLSPEQQSKHSAFLMDMTGRDYDSLGALGTRSTLLGFAVADWKEGGFDEPVLLGVVRVVGRDCKGFPREVIASGFSPNRLARKAVWCWNTHWRPCWIKRWPCFVGLA